MTTNDETARAIALLEATHEFPCDYPITIIVRNEPKIVAEVRASAEDTLPTPLPDSACEVVPSSGGKYASIRLRVPCEDAAAVLALYARVRRVTGVIQML